VFLFLMRRLSTLEKELKSTAESCGALRNSEGRCMNNLCQKYFANLVTHYSYTHIKDS